MMMKIIVMMMVTMTIFFLSFFISSLFGMQTFNSPTRCALPWEHRVLTSGLPEKSNDDHFTNEELKHTVSRLSGLFC